MKPGRIVIRRYEAPRWRMTPSAPMRPTRWFAADGEIWWNKVGRTITVNSPMLIPEGSMQFVIREVVHRQSSAEGTITDIMITNPCGTGGPELFGVQP